MKFTKHLIASAVLLATSSLAIAATDSTTVEINVTKDAYVNLVGSLSGNVLTPLTLAQVDNTTTTLGTLGFESNTTGTCTVAFASAEGYKLVHATDASLDLGDYSIAYAGVTNSSAASNDYVAATCNEVASDMTITSPALPAVVIAGTYSDALTVTVTTQ